MASLPMTGTLDLNDWARMLAGQPSAVAPLPVQPPEPIAPYGGDVRTYGQRGAHQWFGGAGSGMDAFVRALSNPPSPVASTSSGPNVDAGVGARPRGEDPGERDFSFGPGAGLTGDPLTDGFRNALTAAAASRWSTPALNLSGLVTGRDVINLTPEAIPSTIAGLNPFGAVGAGAVNLASEAAWDRALEQIRGVDPAAAKALASARTVAVDQQALQALADELLAEANERSWDATVAHANEVGLEGMFDQDIAEERGHIGISGDRDESGHGLTDAAPDNPGGWSEGSGFEDGSGWGGGDEDEAESEEEDCVIATELLRQEIWTPADRRALVIWCRRTLHGHPAGETVRLGYRTWGRVAVRLMGVSPAATRLFRWLFGCFARQVTGANPTLAGRVIYAVGRRFCWLIGLARGWVIGGDTVQMRDR